MKVTYITDQSGMDKLQDFFDRIRAKGGIIGWDIETTPLKDFFFRRCRTIQFGDTNEQYVIDLLPFCDNDPELLFDCQGKHGVNVFKKAPKLYAMLEQLRPVVCTKDFLKVGVNLGFEYQSFYWLFGMRTFHFYDCMMAEKAIWAGAASLKKYSFFSMHDMVERYFNLSIDKQYQESFTMDAVLVQGQIDYAALDTRFPLALKTVQEMITTGKTLKGLKTTKPGAVKYFEYLTPKESGTGEPIVMGDNLTEIVQLENDAIGAFEDMHIHGERLDKAKWLGRIDESKKQLQELLSDVLDPIFIPYVGNKLSSNTDKEIEEAEELWKSFNAVSDKELALRPQLKAAKAAGNMELYAKLEMDRLALEDARKTEKEIYKTACSDMKKTRTKIKNLAAKCEGNALINYGSDAQLIKIINQMKGLHSVVSLDDENLEKYEAKGHAVMGAIRKLHGLHKEIGTYGAQWAQEWATKPCKEEGWLNPGDGRLHCVYNQYDAETGRSSSEKPNGQNLPQDEAVRSCFIADPPDEFTRVSNCCEKDANQHYHEGTNNGNIYVCSGCYREISKSETHAEEYVIITADMSGAELRIIAELAQDPVWIGAFTRGEDVHSVGTELLRGEAWHAGTEPGCKYYALKENGEPARQKCKCKVHAEQRNDNKSTNFLLAYGGGPGTLSKAIKKTLEAAQELMALHSQKFPKIWAYLEKSGKQSGMLGKSFDMFGRRRLFPEPTWERAKERFIEDNEAKLLIDELEQEQKIEMFKSMQKRVPNDLELYLLTHREPTQKEIGKTLGGMKGTIERQGKNHAIQGTNASIIKLAMGCGFDVDGKPYLWHTLPTYRAKLIKMVHDEVVIQAPKQHAEAVAKLVGDAFKRAAATKMKLVTMEFDFNIAKSWKK
jgi:DNA polymerase I-like protein with 3'-5' exonuclease and polymerase domains